MSEVPGDDFSYGDAIRRIYIHIVWVALVGCVTAAWRFGWPASLGFLIGATASALNFRWLHLLADSLGPGARQPRRGLGLFLSLRYVIFALVGYVIVKSFKVDLLAVLIGLFVAVAAVLVEILYELIYART